MTLEEAANHCERAWSSYATKHGIRREPDAFFLLKIQEKLGELTRHFLSWKWAETSTNPSRMTSYGANSQATARAVLATR